MQPKLAAGQNVAKSLTARSEPVAPVSAAMALASIDFPPYFTSRSLGCQKRLPCINMIQHVHAPCPTVFLGAVNPCFFADLGLCLSPLDVGNLFPQNWFLFSPCHFHTSETLIHRFRTDSQLILRSLSNHQAQHFLLAHRAAKTCPGKCWRIIHHWSMTSQQLSIKKFGHLAVRPFGAFCRMSVCAYMQEQRWSQNVPLWSSNSVFKGQRNSFTWHQLKSKGSHSWNP